MSAITITDMSRLEQTIKDNRLVAVKYYQDNPCLLRIKVDYPKQEMVVEFSGKILYRDYPLLISANTIKECFRHIEELGFCKIDDCLMMQSEVVACDVTKDIHYDIGAVQSYIRGHLSNYNRFLCRVLRNGNVIIENNVATRKYKKRMTIYDKWQEMQKADNQKYMQKYGLTDEFYGKCRFECNLSSKERIRDALYIDDNHIMSVLLADTNPITDFLDEALKRGENKECSDWKAYQRFLVLQDCGFDLAQVERKIRSLYRRGTNIAQVMQPYRDAYQKLSIERNDIIPTLKSLLN